MRRSSKGNPPLRVVFVTDIHSRMPLLDRFVDHVNQVHPDLVIDGGDRIHDGTEAEFRRSQEALRRIDAPYYEVEGNHDAKPVGHFNGPKPTPPEFQTLDRNGVHFVLIDDSKERFSESVLQQLEADLKAHRNKTVVVAMHVPVVLTGETTMIKYGKKLPLNFASPVLQDSQQIDRFTKMMRDYKVDLVLSGHTHYHDETTKDGVRYVTASAAGGQLPGLGLNHEYLDVQFHDGKIDIERVPLDKPVKDPATFMYKNFRAAMELNHANHTEGDWDYNPRESVQFRSSYRYTTTDHGTSEASAVSAEMETARMGSGKWGFTGEAALAGGKDELSADLALGAKYRPIGSYNKGVYVAGAVVGNGGYIADDFSAGVGARAAVGAEYKALTFEVGQEFATNRKMTSVSVGFRF